MVTGDWRYRQIAQDGGFVNLRQDSAGYLTGPRYLLQDTNTNIWAVQGTSVLVITDQNLNTITRLLLYTPLSGATLGGMAQVGSHIWMSTSAGIFAFDLSGNLQGSVAAFTGGASPYPLLNVQGSQVWAGVYNYIRRYDTSGNLLGTIATSQAQSMAVVNNQVWVVGGTSFSRFTPAGVQIGSTDASLNGYVIVPAPWP